MPKLLEYASYYVPLAPGTIIISEDVFTGINLAELSGYPTEPLDVYLTITPNTVVQSNMASRPAVSTRGLPPGSTVQINNFGFIIGAGGKGGSRSDQAPIGPYQPDNGEPGGDAIYADVPVSIASVFGRIWGGGGGAGGYWRKNLYAGDGGGVFFTGGAGGAGRSIAGGGDGGDGNLHGTVGRPFRKGADVNHILDPGTGGTGSYPPGNTTVRQPTGDYLGAGGNYGADGQPSFYGFSVSDSNPNTGQTWFSLIYYNVAAGGKGGYAVNVAQGATLTWLDNANTIGGRIIGKTVERPQADMHYLARTEQPITVIIDSDVVKFNLADYLGIADPQDVFVYIAPFVNVTSDDPLVPAFSTEGMHPQSTLYLKYRGHIIGCGGNGGEDPMFHPPGTITPQYGQDGGDGLYLTIPTTLALQANIAGSTENAIICGGGGGGGLVRLFPSDDTFGGSGGAGGGKGGRGTAGNGSDSVFNPTLLLSTAATAKSVYDWDRYTIDTIWKNRNGRGGNYGKDGEASLSTPYSAANLVKEINLGGRAGYAINSLLPITFVFATAFNSPTSTSYNANSVWTNILKGYIRGQSTFLEPTGQLYPKPPLTSRPDILRPLLLNITSNQFDVNVWEMMGRPGGVVNAIVNIMPNVDVMSSHASIPALTTGAFHPDSKIQVTNGGWIMGCGGEGGGYQGRAPEVDFSEIQIGTTGTPGDGKPGGPAVELTTHLSTYQAVSRVFRNPGDSGYVSNGTVLFPQNTGGGGGGVACITCEYYGYDHPEKAWRYVPGTLTIGIGGAGGGPGGKGGSGTLMNGNDAPAELITRLNYNSYYGQYIRALDYGNFGVGHVLQQCIQGNNTTKDITIGPGAAPGAYSVNQVGGTVHQTEPPIAIATKIKGVIKVANRAAPGLALKRTA